MKKSIYFLFLMLVYSKTFAQPGSNDTTFNVFDNGFFGDGSGFDAETYNIDIQDDGKFIVGGNFTSYNGSSANFIIRLNINGVMDTSFITGVGFDNFVSSISIQTDEKIIAAGGFLNYNGISISRIARINPNGTLDVAFNPGTFDNYILSTVIQNDGKIIVGGPFTLFNGNTANRIARLNSDGTLDPSFNMGTGFNNLVRFVKLQDDGKIIVGGDFTTYNGNPANRIARLNSDGTLDPSFNIGTGLNSSVYLGTIMTDGKIIVGGAFNSFNSSSVANLIRLNSDGSLDTSFNPGLGFNGTIQSVDLQDDGKIIIGGVFSSFNGFNVFNLVRLNSDGSIDNSFNVGSGPNSYVNSIKILDDGKVIIVGDFNSYNGINGLNYFALLDSDGTLVESFNSGTGFDNPVRVIKIQADGKSIIAGQFNKFNGTNGINYIVRLNIDGTMDNSFNTGTGFNNTISDVGIQSDGKIIVVGSFTSFNGVSINNIARLNIDGTLDTTFDPGLSFNNTVSVIAFQSDGKIITGGNFTSFDGISNVNRIARLNTDGSFDSSFNTGLGFNISVFSIDVQTDDKIYVAGGFTSFNGITGIIRIARLNADGTLDGTFNTGTGFNVFASKIVTQLDGKVVVGGSFTSFNGNMGINRIVRLNNDGSLDGTFITGTGLNSSVSAILIQPNGKIIVGGGFTSFNGIAGVNRIVRLNTDGSLDVSFNSGSGFNGSVYDLDLQSDRKIICGGDFSNFYGDSRNKLARLIGDTPPPIGNNYQTFCYQADLNDINVIGNDILWYNQPIGGSTLSGSMLLINGTSYYASQSINGIESEDRLEVSVAVNQVNDLTTTLTNETIFANNTNASYQWLDCDNNNVPIIGAINQSYTATTNGNYAVELNENGCIATSACVTVLSTHIDENSYSHQTTIFPNPSNGNFVVTSSFIGTIYSITDAQGRIIKSGLIDNSMIQINLDDEADGLYFLQINEMIFKLVKQK